MKYMQGGFAAWWSSRWATNLRKGRSDVLFTVLFTMLSCVDGRSQGATSRCCSFSIKGRGLSDIDSDRQ